MVYQFTVRSQHVDGRVNGKHASMLDDTHDLLKKTESKKFHKLNIGG
jgi:hypothetical protein